MKHKFKQPLRNLAKELNIPIILVSQLSRAVETRGGEKRPGLNDLKGSGSIEEYADMVLFLYRPEYYGITQDEFGDSTVGRCEMIIAKNRSGYLDTVRLLFIGKYTKFRDIDYIDDPDNYSQYETFPKSVSDNNFTFGTTLNDVPF